MVEEFQQQMEKIEEIVEEEKKSDQCPTFAYGALRSMTVALGLFHAQIISPFLRNL